MPFKAFMKIVARIFLMKSTVGFSSDDFPIKNYSETYLNFPLFLNKQGWGYFTKYYKEKSVSNLIINPRDILNYKTEILYGRKINISDEYNLEVISNSLLPISIINEKISNEQDDKYIIKLKTNKVYSLENLAQNRYYFFPIKSATTVSVSSEYPLVVGKPLLLDQSIKHKKKLVLNIFIDGLASEAFKGSSVEKMMPHSYNFFSNGFITLNSHINADWTISSVPSIFSGLYPKNHKVHSRNNYESFGSGYKLISEIFQENNYLTSQICSNYGKPPNMGYVKGFDRTIYQRSMSIDSIVSAFLDHMQTFCNRDNYVWLSIMDLHHFLDIVPAISTQKNISLQNSNYKDRKKKSVIPGQDLTRVERYIQELKRVDFYLKIIFDYIRENYSDQEVLVSLCSDHGQSYITKEESLFSEQRAMVPFMMKGTPKSFGMTDYRIDSIDLLPTILSFCDISYDEKFFNGFFPKFFGGALDRKYSIAESIYPGKIYSAVITSDSHRFYFETINKVNPNGLFELKEYKTRILNRISGVDESSMLEDDKVFFTKMIKEHILSKN